MNRKQFFLWIIFIIFGIIKFVYYVHSNMIKRKYTIGIIQCASNMPLDTMVNAYREKLKQIVDREFEIILQNNQGSYMQANVIGEQFHNNDEIDLIFAIGGSAALGITKHENKRPIVIGGISDSTEYDFDKKDNVYGIIDCFDYRKVFALIHQKYQPKCISVLRSAGTQNEKEILPFKNLCLKNGVQCLEFVVNSEGDIMSMLDSAVMKGDLLLIPCDTMVVSAFSYIAKRCFEKKQPLVTCFLDGKKMGATDAIGVDYVQYGEALAILSYQLLKNRNQVYEKFTTSEYSVKN